VSQIGQLSSDIPKPEFGKLASFAAMGTVLQLQQFSYFAETEAESLRGLDESHARQLTFAVTPNATLRPFRLGHQALALIEADRLDVHARSFGEHADGEAPGRGVHGA